MTDISAQRRLTPALLPVDRGPVAVIGTVLVLLAAALAQIVDARQAVLFGIGALLGIALYHGSFGFTAGWRRLAVERRGRQMRAQLVMIGVAAIVFIPLLAVGAAFGRPLVGALAPVGTSVLVGASLFGFGMQLGGGCGSGTLFTVGGGNARMLLTPAFFMVGALVGTAHLPFWLELPALPAISVGAVFGPLGGIAATLCLLGIVGLATFAVENRAHGGIEKAGPVNRTGFERYMLGPWPILWAGLALAVLNIATLLVAGHPWSITFAFGLWGAKIGQALGLQVETWAFWNWPGPATALSESVLYDVTSVMNFGILLGAALGAGLAGKFAPRAKVPLASLLAAGLGGLAMGYGARLSFGCNIGALFSGIASGSLHGWLWFAAAFCGSLGGIAARPFFGLDGFKAK